MVRSVLRPRSDGAGGRGRKSCTSTGSVSFIARDDPVGPYETIDSPFNHYRAPWDSVMVPLPPRVFLTGEAAENDAFLRLRGILAAVDATKPLAQALHDGKVQLRTRLKDVQTFKREISQETSSDEVLRAVRLAQFPHFIWIVEAHVRDLCHHGPCVIASVLYDATSSDRAPRYCGIAIPGAVALFPPDGDKPHIVRGGAEPWRSVLPAH